MRTKAAGGRHPNEQRRRWRKKPDAKMKVDERLGGERRGTRAPKEIIIMKKNRWMQKNPWGRAESNILWNKKWSGSGGVVGGRGLQRKRSVK